MPHADPQPAPAAGLPGFIAEQPAAIDSAFAAAAACRAAGLPGNGAGVVLVGSGSSYNALLAGRAALSQAGLGPVSVVGPEDFLQDGAPAGHGVIVLSQSGNSRTSVAAARAARAAGHDCLGITMNPDAEIGAAGIRLLTLPIGDEPIGPKTKGFTASLAALTALAGGAPAPAGWLAPLVATARAAAAALAPELHALDSLMVCARGAQIGIALEASLKVAEIAGIPSAAFAWEEALHGRLHGLTDRSLAAFITQDEAEVAEADAVAAAMRRRGATVRTVNLAGQAGAAEWWAAPAPPPGWAGVAAILPFQWLATFLATARGQVPELMRYPGLSADLNIKLRPAPATQP